MPTLNDSSRGNDDSRRKSMPILKSQQLCDGVSTNSKKRQTVAATSLSAKAAARASTISRPQKVTSASSSRTRLHHILAGANAFELPPTVFAPLRAASGGGGGEGGEGGVTAASDFYAQRSEGQPDSWPASGPRTPERPSEPSGARAGAGTRPRRPARSPEPGAAPAAPPQHAAASGGVLSDFQADLADILGMITQASERFLCCCFASDSPRM